MMGGALLVTQPRNAVVSTKADTFLHSFFTGQRNMAAKKPKNPTDAEERRLEAYRVRNRANLDAQEQKHPEHKTNGEEDVAELLQFTNFRKGLPHDPDGMVDTDNYLAFRKACEGLKLNEFEKLPIGAPESKFRKWESPTAGAIYDLEGPDAQAVTMPPAPKLGSDELAFEMAEVYLMALLRDVPFADYDKNAKVKHAAHALDCMPRRGIDGTRRTRIITPQNIFRGEGAGVTDGPLISQFLLVGTTDITEPKEKAKSRGINSCDQGFIEYGAQHIDQRVRTAVPQRDFMQNFDDWLHVQNGFDVPNIDKQDFVQSGDGTGLAPRRFITTSRDVATYVHFDQLYQAYLNACLILLSTKAALQPGLPHAAATRTKGFAQFGGPHILTLVTEVATRALKAVRYQKFTQHRRGRPEQIAGLISQYKKFENEPHNPFAAMKPLVDKLDEVMFGKQPLLQEVLKHNCGDGYFLPMAFPEGSPMHPAYGAGHATVAGACVTTLKAFFKTDVKIKDIYESAGKGDKLKLAKSSKALTIEGELNKLAANISIGRNMAGVHYYTDYSKSLKMGEEIALGVLEEQLYTYPEKVSMSLRKFLDGRKVVLKN